MEGVAPQIFHPNQDRKTGTVIPAAELESYKSKISGGMSGSVAKYKGQPRFRGVMNREVVAPTQLGDYQGQGDVISPASERIPAGTTNEPLGGVLNRPEVASFVEKHGSEQQANYARMPQEEQKRVREKPEEFDQEIKNRYR